MGAAFGSGCCNSASDGRITEPQGDVPAMLLAGVRRGQGTVSVAFLFVASCCMFFGCCDWANAVRHEGAVGQLLPSKTC